MNKNTKRQAVFSVMSLLATVMVAITATPADAGTVPNRYYCNAIQGQSNSGWCYQVNGAYDPSVPRQCHWKYSGMSGKPKTLYYTNCDSWGANVP